MSICWLFAIVDCRIVRIRRKYIGLTIFFCISRYWIETCNKCIYEDLKQSSPQFTKHFSLSLSLFTLLLGLGTRSRWGKFMTIKFEDRLLNLNKKKIVSWVVMSLRLYDYVFLDKIQKVTSSWFAWMNDGRKIHLGHVLI